MIIKHLNHELMPFDSKMAINEPETFIGYKCLKCNYIINYTLVNPGRGLYWMHDNGGDYDTYSQVNWDFLELTCEEELIKKLIE